MKREEAKALAMERIFCDMSRGDIEDECRKRGIKVTKSRGNMEKALVEAITNENTTESEVKS